MKIKLIIILISLIATCAAAESNRTGNVLIYQVSDIGASMVHDEDWCNVSYLNETLIINKKKWGLFDCNLNNVKISFRSIELTNAQIISNTESCIEGRCKKIGSVRSLKRFFFDDNIVFQYTTNSSTNWVDAPEICYGLKRYAGDIFLWIKSSCLNDLNSSQNVRFYSNSYVINVSSCNQTLCGFTGSNMVCHHDCLLGLDNSILTDSNVVGAWSFDCRDNRVDIKGRYNGTVTGVVTWVGGGDGGYHIEGGGVTDYLSFGDVPDFNSTNANTSFFVRYIAHGNTGNTGILEKYQSNQWDFILYQLVNGSIACYAYGAYASNHYIFAYTSNAVSFNENHSIGINVFFSGSNSRIEIYVDGVNQSVNNAVTGTPTGWGNGNAPFVFGDTYISDTRNVTLYYLDMYNRARTAGEMLAAHNNYINKADPNNNKYSASGNATYEINLTSGYVSKNVTVLFYKTLAVTNVYVNGVLNRTNITNGTTYSIPEYNKLNLTIENLNGSSNFIYKIIIEEELETSFNCNCSTCDECEIKLNTASCTEVNLTANIINYSGSCIENPENFSNKIFNCQGYTIDGDDSNNQHGIYISGKTNVTIKNCVMSGFRLEIFLWNADSSFIINNTIHGNEFGIWLDWDSDFNTITNNRVSGCSYGFGASWASDWNTFEYNNGSHNFYGLWLNFASRISVNNNSFCNSSVTDITRGGWGLFNTGDNNTCNSTSNWNDYGTIGCTLSCSGNCIDGTAPDSCSVGVVGKPWYCQDIGSGLLLYENCTTCGCNSTTVCDDGDGKCYPLCWKLFDSINITTPDLGCFPQKSYYCYDALSNNVVENSSYCGCPGNSLVLANDSCGRTCYCSDCITCNTLLNTVGCDIVLLTENITDYFDGDCIVNNANLTNKTFDCQGFTIDGDDVDANYGLYLNGTFGTTIRNCIVTDFYSGIFLEHSNNNIIINNTATSNLYGIYLNNASSNNFTLNTVTYCNYDGFYAPATSTGNILSNNTFCSNNQSGGAYYDINDLDSNIGVNNSCNTTNNFNDYGFSGCSLYCDGSYYDYIGTCEAYTATCDSTKSKYKLRFTDVEKCCVDYLQPVQDQVLSGSGTMEINGTCSSSNNGLTMQGHDCSGYPLWFILVFMALGFGSLRIIYQKYKRK